MSKETVVKAKFTKERLDEIYSLASDILTEADEMFLNPENKETIGNILSELVADYVFENDYSNEEEMELCNQVGI